MAKEPKITITFALKDFEVWLAQEPETSLKRFFREVTRLTQRNCAA